MARRTRKRGSRGFSLIELSVVLGVVGVVLGGVWVGIGSSIEESKRATLVSQMTILVRNIRNYYQGMVGVNGGWDQLTSCVAAQGLVPQEMVAVAPANNGGCTLNGGAAAVMLRHPWGTGTVRLRNLTNSNAVYDQFFVVELNGLTTQTCAGVAMRLTGVGGPNGATDAQINGTSFWANLPLTLTNALTLCARATPAVVQVTYRLRKDN